ISHRLEEVFRIADRISVMRDGHYIQTWQKAETNTSEIVAAMVGRKTDEMFIRESSARPQTVLEVENVSVKGKLEPVSLRVNKGEVVGFVGLAGAGVSVLFEALFGVQRPSSGTLLLNGQPAQILDPRAAMEHNVGMVPADRRGLGLMMNWSVLDNLTLSILTRLARLGVIDQPGAQRTAEDYVERLNIVTDSLNKGVLYLSGGNQQKTLLARWLATEPQILILEDPTRGIDVGAKHEIYQMVDRIAADGVAVLFTSSEIEEVLALCDRIFIFRKRRLIAEIPREAADKPLVMEFSAGDVDTAQHTLQLRLATGVPSATPLSVSTSTLSADIPLPQQAQAEPRQQRSTPWLRLLSIREIGVAQALIAVIILFSLLTPFFFTASNLLLISRQMAILGVIAVGMTFVLASGEVDLSVGWTFNMVMSAMAMLMVSGVDPWLTIPIGLALGVLLGVFNG
ncbi:MAG: ATP-binding cassette domain-containing protein, partial [Anaerolineae bacterium]|nr:ATP-binding cassette domain-containing protein [Anaerolineae bacterium]